MEQAVEFGIMLFADLPPLPPRPRVSRYAGKLDNSLCKQLASSTGREIPRPHGVCQVAYQRSNATLPRALINPATHETRVLH